MAQNHLKFGNYTPPPVDEDGYKIAYATTSSSNTNRTMRGVMKNSPLFTVEAYDLKCSYIKATDASKILHEVLQKSGFDFFHFNLYTCSWETRRFYAVNFNAPAVDLTDGAEMLDELSFQVTSEKPVL